MTAPILTFFNNKGGVGKTSLVYHLAWMFALLRKRVLAVDLDPQANLTAAMLTDEQIEELWNQKMSGSTIYQCVKPLTGVNDIKEPELTRIIDDLYLIPGDVALSSYEDTLSSMWPESMGNHNLYRPMRILSSFWQVMQMGAAQIRADLILVDIGPNLGAINRSVLISTDDVAIPLAADLFSLQGLRNLGPTLRDWKRLWDKRMENWQATEAPDYPGFKLPTGLMQPIGYLCQQPSIRLDRPVKAYDKWVQRMPRIYRESVLAESGSEFIPNPDPNCLATIRHYRSLIPIGQEKRKPIFNLTPADGAVGSHALAVQNARRDFQDLAYKIAERMGMPLAKTYPDTL